MARQAGPIFFTGTIDDITFYKMEGQYFARKKSSLDRKQFRTDPRFKHSRQSAARFGEASKLASHIYWLLPKEQRGKGVVNRLTGQVGRLLQEGKTPQEIIAYFIKQYEQVALKKEQKTANSTISLSTHWNVAPSGSLVSTIADQNISTDAIDFNESVIVVNGYNSPMLE